LKEQTFWKRLKEKEAVVTAFKAEAGLVRSITAAFRQAKVAVELRGKKI
jgi:hypothetical protein